MTQRSRTLFLCSFVCALLVLGIGPAGAQEVISGPGGLTTTKLSNGLEVFTQENQAVPLVTILVGFRTGAISQTPETVGLFHLYEHLMFAGNSQYPTQASFKTALNHLGVTNWNGGTSTEYVNYYITIPASKLEEGLKFWAAAIREPLLDPATLEREKGVVINEIKGYFGDPEEVFSSHVTRRMFSQYPWRRDVSGSADSVQKASLAQMKSIQSSFYIPNNAAIFVAGAAKSDEVIRLVKKIWGDWKAGPQPPQPTPPHPGLSSSAKFVFADPDFYDGVQLVSLTFRGPDVLSQTADTYTSDVFLFLLQSAVGKFKTTLAEKVPDLYSPEYVDFSYPTQRDGGVYTFSTYLLADPENPGNVFLGAENLRKAFLDEMAIIAKDPAAYFGDDELALAKTKLSDNNIISAETASGYMQTLNFWWSTATTDYFLNYEKNCKAVTFADISSLIQRYILNKPSITGLRVTEGMYAADPAAAAEAKQLGYDIATPDNAYWWQIK